MLAALMFQRIARTVFTPFLPLYVQQTLGTIKGAATYTGIINGSCPKCNRKESDGGPQFERIRRITGYLVGTLDRFNNAKRAEERDRFKHMSVPKA